MVTKKQKIRIANAIIRSLKKQGFKIRKRGLEFNASSKRKIRVLHSAAVRHLLEKNKKFIKKYDKKFVKEYIADGKDIDPTKISPKLIMVDDDKKAKVFRWVKLHWSIPISSGYGRRLRYLVIDENTNKLIGIIGLGDPVYALKDREEFIGWSSKIKSKRLKNLMDAFVLGAVPPYNKILCGKLIASLVASKEVFRDFNKKYGGKKSLIRKSIFDGKLAGVTTASALGKSSVYDRIRIPNGPEFFHIGWTSGSGDFHFLNGHYDDLTKVVRSTGYTGKNKKWGIGLRSRRVVVRNALKELGLPPKFIYHGIRRELFFVPLGRNWKSFLCGKSKRLNPFSKSVKEIAGHIKHRWIIQRSERDKSYLIFKSNMYRMSKV